MTSHEVFQQLSAPFTTIGADGQEYPAHKWKMLTNAGICVPYVDARQVAERLNLTLGVEGWSSTLIETAGQYMICELTCNINGQSITKSDVGTPSEYEKEKGQASDALKRSAALFGVGAYLYSMEPIKLETVQVGKNRVPITSDGKHLSTGDLLTSYINQLHPLRAKLTEIYKSLNSEQKEKLQNQFTTIWETLKS